MAAEICDNNFAIGSFYRSDNIATMQSISSGSFVLVERKFICINQHRKTHAICVSTEDVFSFGSLSMSQTSQSNERFILRQIRPDRKDTIALEYLCNAHVI